MIRPSQSTIKTFNILSSIYPIVHKQNLVVDIKHYFGFYKLISSANLICFPEFQGDLFLCLKQTLAISFYSVPISWYVFTPCSTNYRTKSYE